MFISTLSTTRCKTRLEHNKCSSYRNEEIWEKCANCSVATGDNRHAYCFKPDSEKLDQTRTWYRIKKIKARDKIRKCWTLELSLMHQCGSYCSCLSRCKHAEFFKLRKKTWTQQMEFKSEEIWEKCTNCSVATGDNKHARCFKPDPDRLNLTQTWYHLKKIKAIFECSKFSLSED